MKRSAALVADVPPTDVTVMSTVPAVRAGENTVISESELTVIPAAGVPPKETPVAPLNPVPLIVTSVLPATGPVAGEMEETTGAATYVYCTGLELPVTPKSEVTVTFTEPAEPAGTVAVIWVSEFTVYEAAFAPKETFVVVVKPVPVSTTVLPPASGPLLGETDVSVGKPGRCRRRPRSGRSFRRAW